MILPCSVCNKNTCHVSVACGPTFCDECPECHSHFETGHKRSDPVNSPKHYTSKAIEVIDIIEAWDMNFRLGNVIKYVLRHADKNGLEDLKKARWYLDREITKREAK